MGLKSIALSSVLFVFLVFTSSLLTANVSAFAPNGEFTPLRPEWIREGDYVTYLYSVTAQGLTATIHKKVTIQDDSGVYLNRMRLELFGEQIPPNFPSGFGILDPQFAENTNDGFFITREEKVAKFKPEIELVRGLNNKTYEAYRLTFDQINDFGDCSDCNTIVWYEKETLIKVKQLEWYEVNGINATFQQLIEDSNISELASASTNNTSSAPAKTVTTTIFVKPPQTIVTTTSTVTVTTTVTGSRTVETTTVTETRNTSDSTAAAIPISAGILAAGAVMSIVLLKRKIKPS